MTDFTLSLERAQKVEDAVTHASLAIWSEVRKMLPGEAKDAMAWRAKTLDELGISLRAYVSDKTVHEDPMTTGG